MPRKHNQDALPRDKLLVLYQRLTLDGKKHFQSDMARDLGCSVQTVGRLVDVVERHLGKDSFIERGLEGRRRYFQLRSKTQEKALGFSFEELHYLATCRDLAAQFLPQNVSERIGKTLTIMALHLAEGGGQSRLPGQSVTFRNKGSIDYTPHLGTIAALRQAIDKRQVCRVNYQANGREEARAYRYAPGQIIAMSGTLYVQGYRLADGSLIKERPTTFSLHRIKTVAATGEYFSFNASDDEVLSFGLPWHEPKRVSILVNSKAADYVRDRMWSDDQAIVEQDDGSLILTVSTTNERELQAWAWSFGDQARII